MEGTFNLLLMVMLSATTMFTTSAMRLPLGSCLRLRPRLLMLLRLRTIHLRLWPVHLWLWPVHVWLRTIHIRLRPVHIRRRPPRIIIRRRPIHRRRWPSCIIIRRRAIHRRRRTTRTRCWTIYIRCRTTRTGCWTIYIRRRTTRIWRRIVRMINRRPCYSHIRRPPMIHRSKLIPVMHRRLLMLLLFGRTLDMPVTHRRLLTRIRTIIDPARTTIIADPVDSYIPDHRSIDVSIVYDRSIDTRHRRIIPETTTIPFPTIISTTAISTAIVDPSIVTYMRPPITGIPPVDPTYITPITWRP